MRAAKARQIARLFCRLPCILLRLCRLLCLHLLRLFEKIPASLLRLPRKSSIAGAGATSTLRPVKVTAKAPRAGKPMKVHAASELISGARECKRNKTTPVGAKTTPSGAGATRNTPNVPGMTCEATSVQAQPALQTVKPPEAVPAHQLAADSYSRDLQLEAESLPCARDAANAVVHTNGNRATTPGAQTLSLECENCEPTVRLGEPEGECETALPPYIPLAEATFVWGKLTGTEFGQAIHAAYQECVHWRRNVFLVPSGSVGKQFVKELTRLFDAYSQRSALESVALEAIGVACILLLPKPHTTSKCQDHVSALNRRMKAWQEGDIDEL